MFAPLRVNTCVSLCFVSTRVFIEGGWRLQILMSQLWEEEAGRVKGGKDKIERVQSSEADDCVFVGVNLFITDAGEISIEMILVTDLPWISPVADTQNVYVYRTRGGERAEKGTVV